MMSISKDMDNSEQSKPDFYLAIERPHNVSEMNIYSCRTVKRVSIKDEQGYTNNGCLLIRIEPSLESRYIRRFNLDPLPPLPPLDKLIVLAPHATLFPVLEWPVDVTLLYPLFFEGHGTFGLDDYIYLCEDAGLFPSEASARNPKAHLEEFKYPQPRTLRRRLYTTFSIIGDKIMEYVKKI